jgi:predicted dehydrogenase
MTSEDQVALVGQLEGGAMLSCHYRGGVSKATNLRVEINGSRGDLQLEAAGGHAQLFDLTIKAASGDDAQLRQLATPESYYHTPLRSGPAVNVAEAYVRVGADLQGGGRSFPDFAHGLRRHRLIEAILESAAAGERRQLV